MNRWLERKRLKIIKAEMEFKAELANVQRKCKHTELAECDHLPEVAPPLRVCLNCGMTEDGWGPGYVVLKGDAVQRSRDAIYDLRGGVHVNQFAKGRLIRKEVTVVGLVNELEKKA